MRRIFGAEMRMKKNTFDVLFKQKCYGDEIKEYEMSGTSSMHEEEKNPCNILI
jgi:hypothetical protein